MSAENRLFNYLLWCSLLVISLSCKSSKYAKTDKVYRNLANGYAEIIKSAPPLNQAIDSMSAENQSWVGSVNFGIRRANFVILHHTAQDSAAQTLQTFTTPRTQVSAHYVVGRDGKVIQMVNDYLRAQHAGESRWGNNTDLNSSSLGIELDNNGNEPYSDQQINSLYILLATLKKKYGIPTANFIGHADIAPARKPDPNNFPWKNLAEKGYGLWYDDSLEVAPMDFDSTIALRIIGYDVRNMEAAIVAFKRHFIQVDISPVLTVWDKSVLYNLYKKYL